MGADALGVARIEATAGDERLDWREILRDCCRPFDKRQTTQAITNLAVFPNPGNLLRPGLNVTLQSRIKPN
jgi:hypothetical protein